MTRNNYAPPGARVGDSEGSAIAVAVRYAALFACCHFALSISIGWIFEMAAAALGTAPRGAAVGVAINIAAASIVGAVFVRRLRRNFKGRERTYMFVACLLYLFSFDAFVLWANPQYQVATSISSWAIMIGVTLGIDTIALLVAFKYGVAGSIKRYLERNPQALPAKSQEGTHEQ